VKAHANLLVCVEGGIALDSVVTVAESHDYEDASNPNRNAARNAQHHAHD
jgi:hypothetical protein